MLAMMRLCRYYFQEAFLNIRRNGWMTVSAVGTVTFALLIIGIFFLVSINITTVFSGMRAGTLVIVYLQDNLQPYDQERIMTEIKQMPEVGRVEFISKEENLNRFQEDLGDLRDIFSELENNPLPASFEVEVADEQVDVAALAGKLDLLSGVEDVDYGREILQLLSRIGMGLRFLILVIGLALGLAALFIITNTIRITVIARRDEIEIMRLVGATDWYIRWPYFIEGLVQGFFASALAIVFIYGFYHLIIFKFPLLPFLPVQLTFFSVTLCARLILIGALIGACGSLLAIRHVFGVLEE